MTRGLLSRLLSEIPPEPPLRDDDDTPRGGFTDPDGHGWHGLMGIAFPQAQQTLVGHGNGQDLSITAWAFVRLILDGSCPSFSEASSDATSAPSVAWADIHRAASLFLLTARRLSAVMGSQELSNTLWAAAKLSALAERASGQLDACGDEEDEMPSPSTLSHSLDQPPPPRLFLLLQSFLSESVLGPRATLMAQTGRLADQHIPTILWACARLQIHDGDLLDALSGSMLRHVRKAKPQGLSIALWALARLGHRHDALLKAVARAVVVRLNRNDPKFRGQGLANLAWALTRFRYVVRILREPVRSPGHNQFGHIGIILGFDFKSTFSGTMTQLSSV